MRRRIPSAIVIYVIAASVAVAGIFIWDQLSRPSPTLNLNDPAMRARAAAQSITGEPTVRHIRVDEATGRVVVEARSKYYKASGERDENRQYLATEGRLIVQLILHDLPELSEAEVDLYDVRRRLVSVIGRPGQQCGQYTVSYTTGW